MHKLTQINLVLKDYFDLNSNVKIVPAKNLMPYFVLAGIFSKDEKNGLPIHYLLKKLESKNQLKFVPFATAIKKEVYTKWVFENKKISIEKIISIQNNIIKSKVKKS
jgi:hypothetical protein